MNVLKLDGRKKPWGVDWRDGACRFRRFFKTREQADEFKRQEEARRVNVRNVDKDLDRTAPSAGTCRGPGRGTRRLPLAQRVAQRERGAAGDQARAARLDPSAPGGRHLRAHGEEARG